MAHKDIPGNFDIEIKFNDDIFPDVYEAEFNENETEPSSGNFLFFKNLIEIE